MDWMSDIYLQLLAIGICVASLYKMSLPGFVFGLSLLLHDLFIGGYSDSNPMLYMSSDIALCVLVGTYCLHTDRKTNDLIAFRLAVISAFGVAAGALSMGLYWSMESGYDVDMVMLWPLYASILIFSILAILTGGDSDRVGLGDGIFDRGRAFISRTVRHRLTHPVQGKKAE